MPRIVRGAEAAGSAGAGERHLIEIQFAEQHCAGCFEPASYFCIFGGNTIVEDSCGCSRTNARGVDIVLEGERNPVNWTEPSARLEAAVGFAGLIECRVRLSSNEGVQLRIELVDVGETE